MRFAASYWKPDLTVGQCAMTTEKIKIIHLDAMRVASSYAFGSNPEARAWSKLVEWAKPKGYLNDNVNHPVFGFNNPYPTADTPRYGYEFWIKVGVEVEPEGEIRIEEFLGGTFAVTRCQVQGHPETNIPAAWKALADWCKKNGHSLGSHHALERFLSSPDDLNNLELELLCPVIS